MVFQRAETRHPLVLLRPQPRNYLANLNQEEEEEGPVGEGGVVWGGLKWVYSTSVMHSTSERFKTRLPHVMQHRGECLTWISMDFKCGTQAGSDSQRAADM